MKGVKATSWHPQYKWWGIVAYESPIDPPRLLWHDAKEWMMSVFALLEQHPGLVRGLLACRMPHVATRMPHVACRMSRVLQV